MDQKIIKAKNNDTTSVARNSQSERNKTHSRESSFENEPGRKNLISKI